MNLFFFLALVAATTGAVLGVSFPCLHTCDCIIESDSADNLTTSFSASPSPDTKKYTIDCADLEIYFIPFPYAVPHKKFTHLDASCNKVKNLPPAEFLKSAFPDLQSIDLKGNYNFNCSSLKDFDGKIEITTDCGLSTKKECAYQKMATRCVNVDNILPTRFPKGVLGTLAKDTVNIAKLYTMLLGL